MTRYHSIERYDFVLFQPSTINQLPKPSEEQIRLLTELFLCGFGDQIARRNGKSDQYNIPSMEDNVKIHPHSGKNSMFHSFFSTQHFSLGKIAAWLGVLSIDRREPKRKHLFEELHSCKASDHEIVFFCQNSNQYHCQSPSQIVAVCPGYLTFVRDRRNAPSYDENFGNVRAEYQVTYSSRGWSLGSHVRRLDDDNETMLR